MRQLIGSLAAQLQTQTAQYGQTADKNQAARAVDAARHTMLYAVYTTKAFSTASVYECECAPVFTDLLAVSGPQFA